MVHQTRKNCYIRKTNKLERNLFLMKGKYTDSRLGIVKCDVIENINP